MNEPSAVKVDMETVLKKHSQAYSEQVREILEVFQYAAKVRISILTGLAPSFLSHPHENYGSYKEFYSPQYDVKSTSERLAKYAFGGFLPWAYQREGSISERFNKYMELINQALTWAFHEAALAIEAPEKEVISYLGVTLLYSEEALYQWASNL